MTYHLLGILIDVYNGAAGILVRKPFDQLCEGHHA